MPIQQSRFYNDPALGQAFNNIAQMFAPPSGSDLAGYASVKAKKEEAERLALAFGYRNDPDYNREMADRIGVLSGLYTPNQSYYGVDQGNATQRYGYDRTYQASRENNTADNARALQTNAADNARAVQTNDTDNARAFAQTRYGAISKDAVLPELPSSVADMYGLPASGVVSGNIAAAPGERIVTPDGRTIEGAAKPLSESEVKGTILQSLTPEERRAIGLKEGAVTLSEGQIASMPDGSTLRGAPKPLSEQEWRAQQNERLRQSGQLSDQMLVDAVLGDKTPVQAVGSDGKGRFMSPGAAVREGAQPYDKPTAEKMDNYLAVGPNGEEVRFLGYVGPDGHVYNADTQQPVPNVVRKESTGGGMSFETDGQGGIKLTTGNAAGNTTARVTDLQRSEQEAGRAVNELTSLFETLRPDDLGAAGNINDLLTNYGAQMFPTLARPDVASTRAQLRATTLGLARALVQDERLSDGDRRAANEVMVSDGLGESLPGAQAKLAALIALNAYRKKYANTARTGGERLPPLDGAMLGRLVDEGSISPRVAEVYAKNVLRHAPQATGGLIPGVADPESAIMPPAPPTPPSARGGPQPGAIEDGYRFLGGDAANSANWERVQ